MTGDDLRTACEATAARLLPKPTELRRQQARGAAGHRPYRLTGEDIDADVCVAVRPRLRPAEVPLLAEAFDRAACGNRMLFTDYVTAGLAEKLKAHGIWFADAQGNAAITVPGRLVLHVTGNRPTGKPAPRGQHYSAAGAKVLHYLIKHGPHVRATYRQIREETRISIDKTGKLIRELEVFHTLRMRGRGDYQLLDGDAVLRLWVDAYAAKLAPALLLGRYAAAPDLDFGFLIQEARAELEGNAVVGGEVAADKLTGHLRPGLLRLYIPKDRTGDVRLKLRLAPSEQGTIELCALYGQALVGEPASPGVPTADPAFVYAELLADGDDRLTETAMRLRKEHLAWTL